MVCFVGISNLFCLPSILRDLEEHLRHLRHAQWRVFFFFLGGGGHPNSEPLGWSGLTVSSG